MVGSGPVTGGSGWLGTWYSSRQPIGNYYLVDASLDNNQVAIGSGLFGGVATSNGDKGFLNNDMQQVGNRVLVGGPLSNGFSSPNPFYNQMKGGVIGRMLAGSWGEDTIVPGFYHSPNMGYINDGVGIRIAFDPTGIIGYAVFIGRDSTSYGNSADSTLMPIVYQSFNGGTTWSLVPALWGYDWTASHPELFLNVGKLRPQPPAQYKLFINNGIDLVVDSLGVLHLVGTVTDPYLGSTGGIDSLNLSYTYNWDYRNAHPVIWDLMTDGTTWNTMLVDSIMTAMPGSDAAVDTTTQFNCWTNAAPQGARIQVSRTPTGGKLFYSWVDSDTTLTHYIIDTFPDIYMRGYDIRTQMVTATKNVTSGNGNCYFHYMSDVGYYDNNTSEWVSPMVYTTSHLGFIPYDTVDHYYIDCGAFSNGEFTLPAMVNYGMPWSVSDHVGQQNLDIGTFPNPFASSTTFTINNKASKTIQLEVYDMLGNLVDRQNVKASAGINEMVFDGSELEAGIYYYVISTNTGKAGGKVILQK